MVMESPKSGDEMVMETPPDVLLNSHGNGDEMVMKSHVNGDEMVMKSHGNCDEAGDRHLLLDMIDGNEHIKLLKTKHGSECTIFVKKTPEIVHFRQSHLEKLEEQTETKTTNFDFLDEIDAEIMRKKKRTEKVDLYMTDYDDIELEDFDGIKGGGHALF